MSAHTPIAAPPNEGDRADRSDRPSDGALAVPERSPSSGRFVALAGHDSSVDRDAADLSIEADEGDYAALVDAAPNPPQPDPADEVPPALAKVLGGIGRCLITIGVLLLLFAMFQLWGTGLAESRAQDDLSDRFSARLAEQGQAVPAATPTVRLTAGPEFDALDPTVETAVDTAVDTAEQTPESEPEAAPPAELIEVPAPEVGTPIGMLAIPAIGVDKTIVEGTTRDALRSGPGHYESTPLPGRAGNTAIAGHRTTHGAPFFDLDLLKPGDEIHIETLEGTATYRVEAHDDGTGGQIGHIIVDPSEVGVIADKGDNRLTLTACHPKYSAKERIIVTAALVTEPLAPLMMQAPLIPPLEQTTEALPEPRETVAEDAALQIDPQLTPEAEQRMIDELAQALDRDTDLELGGESDDTVAASLGWQPEFLSATLLWALFTGLIAAAGWVVGRLWRRWPAYAMAVPPFSLALFYCFSNLEKFLPAV